MISPYDYSASLPSSAPKSGEKRAIDGQLSVANKRVKVNQDVIILKLPIDVLRVMMCFTDWLTDTRAIALTCQTFKRVVDRRPQVVLAKALFFLRCHPLTYLADDSCRRIRSVGPRPYCDSLADVPFARNLLLTSLQPMLSRADITRERCSVADTERLRDRLGERCSVYFDYILHYLLDSQPSDLLLSSFLTPLVSCQARSPSRLASRLKQKGGYPKIQERLTLDLDNERAFKALLNDLDWTEEKIKTVDWSLTYIRKHFKCYFHGFSFTTLLGNANWRQSLRNIHLPRECLLTFLLGFAEETSLTPNILGKFLTIFSEYCDNLDFMKCALKAVGIQFRAVVYSCRSERLKFNRDLALYAIQNGLPWCALPPIFLEDREILLAAISTNSLFLVSESADLHIMKALKNIKKVLREDKEFLLNFLKNCTPIIVGQSRGLQFFISLRDLPSDFIADQQFMQAAARYHLEIFTYVTQNFENVQDVVALIKQISSKLLVYGGLPEKWRTNEEVGKALIEKIGDLDHISECFRSNRQIALRAIAKNALNLYKTPLCMEREFVCEAFDINPKIVGLSSSQYNPPLKKWLAKSRPRVLKMVQADGDLIRSLPPRFKTDPKIAVAACLQDPLVIQWLDLSKNEEFLLSMHHEAMQRLQPLVQVKVGKATTQSSEPIAKG